MDYSYEIQKLLPKNEFMVVVYRANAYPDYYKTFNPQKFDEAHLKELIEGFAPAVVDFWQRQAGHPEEAPELIISGTASADAPVIVNIPPGYAPELLPVPDYDPFTQYVTQNEIENPLQETVGWTVHDMNTEEIADFLAYWRSNVAVTMRQARMALAQQGLLQTVEDAIELIPEPDKSVISIEWEYSAVVQRSSSWVGVLAPALGMNDEQMDDLFKLAGTL